MESRSSQVQNSMKQMVAGAALKGQRPQKSATMSINLWVVRHGETFANLNQII